MLQYLTESVKRYRERQKLLAELYSLSLRDLADAGITLSDIPRIIASV